MARDEDRRREGSRVTDNGFRRRVRRFGACVLQERFTPRSVHSTRLHPIYFEETRDEPVHGTRFLPKKHSRTRIATLTTTDGTTFPPPIEVKSTMTRHCFLVLSILALSIAGCVLAVQAETSSLRREFYGPSKPEFLVEYLEGHGSPRENAAQDERYQSTRPSYVERRLFSRGSILPGKGRWYVHEGKAEDDRFSRNLDQIGGGNLLRRGLVVERDGSYDSSRRWLPSRRNLDQIGGGNLLREADYRSERNLDSIGGGNLVRGLDGAADHLRRNLDQIGGGNLVRNLPDDASREPAETR
ncbi:uncharacterized protein LOC126917413 isoform X1 [Bombus affinis]|uniref:uncharacterized protein LOC126917413 isoform X1 n=1 Tax=Bombus affinis TaxID=309941 RepID=UPI0021B72486|nr:uncharacterized protein LOC126917413 isoform X1 [Bombus affinis]